MMPLLTREALDAAPYPRAVLDALFNAILVDDDVDETTDLPASITLDYDQAILTEAYCVSRQLWAETDHRQLLIELVDRLRQTGTLDGEDRLRFKYARAKLKHLRFACALFGTEHAYPTMMDHFTVALGQLQDAYRVGAHGRVARRARLCRLLLTAVPQAMIRREQDRFRPSTRDGFRTYVASEIRSVESIVRSPTLTGADFHALRKILSRLVAFYNALLALRPTAEAYQMSRYLAAINGLMGAEHDRLVERKIAGVQDYHRDRFDLSPDIRCRIGRLVACYGQSGLLGS
ncbi:hypothetical protein Q4F19_15845 [Sphingomonas sp. BIUV-7]|uniref:CHAD domain-containing protein n=1 Tax=Sphingomonas natans TaxID=3063330 RepID=A0ABT8YC18_9SPHN|nr:hypothetical protein [Sphingomonas sp. BIUV-7]MDO6415864.1 hypothetical protein [Sphingomonas sp. BIUV-7]